MKRWSALLVLAAILGGACATAENAARAAPDDLTTHDIADDRDTQHGQSQGAVFP